MVLSSNPDDPAPPVRGGGASEHQGSAVRQWVVDLANHYDKLDVCLGR